MSAIDFKERRGWGHNFGVTKHSDDFSEIHLWTISTPLPKEGTELVLPLKDGGTSTYRATKVEPCRNPWDMAWCDAELVEIVRGESA